jgi:hypothetical protein
VAARRPPGRVLLLLFELSRRVGLPSRRERFGDCVRLNGEDVDFVDVCRFGER